MEQFEPNLRPPPERLTLASMDLPVNMAVVDYRINRRIGYWDGKGLSQHPVSTAVPIDRAPRNFFEQQQWNVRRWLMVVNAVTLAVLLGVLFWRRRA